MAVRAQITQRPQPWSGKRIHANALTLPAFPGPQAAAGVTAGPSKTEA
jgi:hypothetical protein